MNVVGILVIACVFTGVKAPGHTKLCRNCPVPVQHPGDCLIFQHCKDLCVTDVHLHNGAYLFKYTCHHGPACDLVDMAYGPGHPHEHQYQHHVCRECCDFTGCDRYACTQFLQTTHAPTTAAPTTPVPTTSPSTTTTTVEPSATTKHNGMANIQPTTVGHTQSQQVCTDVASLSFTCDDMKYFGYCDPASGSGYALAQARCPKTCGFCK